MYRRFQEVAEEENEILLESDSSSFKRSSDEFPSFDSILQRIKHQQENGISRSSGEVYPRRFSEEFPRHKNSISRSKRRQQENKISWRRGNFYKLWLLRRFLKFSAPPPLLNGGNHSESLQNPVNEETPGEDIQRQLE